MHQYKIKGKRKKKKEKKSKKALSPKLLTNM
jgi:hypothetical protein